LLVLVLLLVLGSFFSSPRGEEEHEQEQEHEHGRPGTPNTDMGRTRFRLAA